MSYYTINITRNMYEYYCVDSIISDYKKLEYLHKWLSKHQSLENLNFIQL